MTIHGFLARTGPRSVTSPASSHNPPPDSNISSSNASQPKTLRRSAVLAAAAAAAVAAAAMRQRASLDIIADDRSGRNPPSHHDGDIDQEAALNRAREDSRSSSSSSSPAPADNDESDFFLGANDSQSSLGVPNLQDMQVTDDECLVPVNRLPSEILISIFAKLGSPSDIFRVMLTCKRWARNAVDILWHRPACSNWDKHALICQTLGVEQPYFSYRDFIRRLNLSGLADRVNDGSVMPLAVCTRVERLTLTGCRGLTDSGLIALVQNNPLLLALDISLDEQITEASINAIAASCRRLQGLNISGCTRINSESMVRLAESCKYIKRLKLNDCQQLSDEAISAFAENCPNILEIDLHQCKNIGNEPITALLSKGNALRELRLASCEMIDDGAFLSLPPHRTYEHLRILDLTSCAKLTDRAVEKIVEVAPRLRNLVLAKCRNITDAAVYAISKLGKNLHYVHLGHCGHITDEAVKRLVQCCNRIRYIDLGCCVHLTDESVTRLASLPKLKRIGLVKCGSITDESVYALAKANQRLRPRRDADGNVVVGEQYASHSSLERVHLSYCTNLTLKSIVKLLNSCPRLTHLSLTGVQAFLREDLETFCRDAPPEFTDHQRQVFCVFSGQGVYNLRKYLNNENHFPELQDSFPGDRSRIPVPPMHVPGEHGLMPVQVHPPDGTFDDGEADVVEDDDGLDDGTEMVIDVPVPPNHVNAGVGAGLTSAPHAPRPPPQMVPPMTTNPFGYVGGHPPYVPQQVRFHDDPILIPLHATELDEAMEEMDIIPSSPPPYPSSGAGGTILLNGPQALTPESRQASIAGPSTSAAGASTAPLALQNRSPTPFAPSSANSAHFSASTPDAS